MHIIPTILQQAPAIAAIRRDLHAHPELSFEELRTADLVAEKLVEWGITVHRGLGKTGVVGMIKNGTSTRALGLRADMDALPMQESNKFAHASQYAGKMHACGHDGHTAMLLAAAQHLASERDFDGTVYLIFQPAEEHGGGARQMVKDGLFTLFPMEAVFGMHNDPGMPAGQFAVSPGPVMASNSDFKITVRGKGGHGAYPHLTVDALLVACQMVQSFQTILSRNKKPTDAGVVSVTMMHVGDATNIIADSCVIQGTVRTFSLDVLSLIEQRMRQIAEHTAQAFGAQAELKFDHNYPPTINTAYHAEFMRTIMASVVGEKNTHQHEASMGAEDFAFLLQATPGAYGVIGNGNGAHRAQGHGEGLCMLHNASYDFNDAVIPQGATLWARLVKEWLAPSHCPPKI